MAVSPLVYATLCVARALAALELGALPPERPRVRALFNCKARPVAAAGSNITHGGMPADRRLAAQASDSMVWDWLV